MDSFGQMQIGSFVRLFFGFCILEATRTILALIFSCALYPYVL